MKTQQDNQVRMVALENLKAMCELASGMCHRYWIHKVTRSRVWVGYSNPNEYGSERHVYAVFPCYPSGWVEDEDNPRVVLDCLRIVGGGEEISIDAFYLVTDGPHLWRNPQGTWKTEAEIVGADKVPVRLNVEIIPPTGMKPHEVTDNIRSLISDNCYAKFIVREGK